MSDNYLRLIPSSPVFIPDKNAIDKAVFLLKEDFPDPDMVRIEISGSPRFIDQGANWERIVCPCCNETLDLGWWQNAMDNAFANGFQNLIVKVPCCGIETTLNDLIYDWPAGFAQFLIEISNPGMGVADARINQLETILGSPLRKIWAHY
jgi:hypothetical protein